MVEQDAQLSGRDHRQTDRQTDRFLIARPCLHCMQLGKKYAFAIVWLVHVVRIKLAQCKNLLELC